MKKLATTKTVSTNLNKNQFLAIQLLATGKSGKSVAKELHVTEETVSRWRQEPEFKRHLNNLLIESQSVVQQRLAGMMTRVLDTIDGVLDDGSLKPKEKFVMGIKLLELCRIKEIGVKIEDTRDIMEWTKLMAQIKEREKDY